MKTRTIGILGLGHVGAHVAYTLAVQGLADTLILSDINRQKAISECQDIRDAVAYLPHRVMVQVGELIDFGACDILINCVGESSQLATKDRLSELKFTIPMVDSIVQGIKESGFSGILVNITNPCDIITYHLIAKMGMPKGRVFGTGSALDTSRLLSAISQRTGIDHKSITAYMLGEHGKAQFSPWSCVCFRGMPLEDWAETSYNFRLDQDVLEKEAIDGGWVTVSGKGCTEYGIASTAAYVVRTILHDEKAVIPVSMELHGEYGESGLCAGVPCVIGSNGVEEIIELPLTEIELKRFHSCCDVIRGNMKSIEGLLR